MMHKNHWPSEQKSHFMLKFMNKAFMNLPLPCNINYYWNLGSLLSFCLMVQLMTGMLLAMHYCPEIMNSFSSMAHMERNMYSGHMLRNLHANSASMFFLCVYLHMSRNIYHITWSNKMTWSMGMTIYLTMMMTAFVGYVLPWGQMSFWAATVMTNLFSAIPYIGNSVVLWIWGSFSVSNPTLNRFYSLHYLFPFMLTSLMMMHMLALQTENHSNPTGNQSEMDQMPFHHYFTTKDLQTMLLASMMIFFMTTCIPHTFSDPENFMKANPLMTPTHMQPEWYFLFAYSMLRSIPNKLGGMLALIGSMAMLYLMIMLKQNHIKTTNHRPNLKLTTWLLSMTFMMLTWMGSKPAEPPYTTLSLMMTTWYFTSFLTLMPLHSNTEKNMIYTNMPNLTNLNYNYK